MLQLQILNPAPQSWLVICQNCLLSSIVCSRSNNPKPKLVGSIPQLIPCPEPMASPRVDELPNREAAAIDAHLLRHNGVHIQHHAVQGHLVGLLGGRWGHPGSKIRIKPYILRIQPLKIGETTRRIMKIPSNQELCQLEG